MVTFSKICNQEPLLSAKQCLSFFLGAGADPAENLTDAKGAWAHGPQYFLTTPFRCFEIEGGDFSWTLRYWNSV